MDFDRIREAARGYEKDMTAFLRAIVRHPGESCGERAHAETIAAEMQVIIVIVAIVVVSVLLLTSQTWAEVPVMRRKSRLK